jgi:hypothetical protein
VLVRRCSVAGRPSSGNVRRVACGASWTADCALAFAIEVGWTVLATPMLGVPVLGVTEGMTED